MWSQKWSQLVANGYNQIYPRIGASQFVSTCLRMSYPEYGKSSDIKKGWYFASDCQPIVYDFDTPSLIKTKYESTVNRYAPPVVGQQNAIVVNVITTRYDRNKLATLAIAKLVPRIACQPIFSLKPKWLIGRIITGVRAMGATISRIFGKTLLTHILHNILNEVLKTLILLRLSSYFYPLF